MYRPELTILKLMSTDAKNPTFTALVKTVINTQRDGVTPLMKTRENGEHSPYQLCSVEITEGPLKGKAVWAQRTLQNRDGLVKSEVVANQECSVVVTIANNKPFFEIAIGATVATDAEIMAALAGLGTPVVAEPVNIAV